MCVFALVSRDGPSSIATKNTGQLYLMFILTSLIREISVHTWVKSNFKDNLFMLVPQPNYS